MKRKVEESRKRMRAQYKEEGDEYWKRGQADLAVRKYSESINITHEMTLEFIMELKKRHVEYIVAPYEADAQLAFLSLTHYVSLVITEDSDLLAFGCNKVLYKLDAEGYGHEIDIKDLAKATELDFKKFDGDMLLKTCILSGCDYLSAPRGMNLMKAHKYMSEYNDLDTILAVMSKENKSSVPERYKEDFEKAFLTFKFQTVYDPINKKLRHLNSIAKTDYNDIYNQIHKYKDKSFLGVIHEQKVAVKIAKGEINPVTLEPFNIKEKGWADSVDVKEKEESSKIMKKTKTNVRLNAVFQFKETKPKTLINWENTPILISKRKLEDTICMDELSEKVKISDTKDSGTEDSKEENSINLITIIETSPLQPKLIVNE